ncbi:MAG: right-handed parallel beta-helix repeat-containing protein [Patescibacteria group bacterium]
MFKLIFQKAMADISRKIKDYRKIIEQAKKKIKAGKKVFLKKSKKFIQATKKKIRSRKFTRKQIIFIGFLIFFLLAAGDWALKNGGLDFFKKIRLGGNDKFASRTFSIHKDQSALLPSNLDELILGPVSQGGGKIFDNLKTNYKAKPGDNLQEMINNLDEYGIIYLAAGTYPVNLFINKKVRIIGEGGNAVLKAENEKNAIIKVRDGGLGIENVSLVDSTIGIDAGNSELFINNSKFDNISATAFYARNCSLEFKNNSITNCGEAIKTFDATGSISNSIISDSLKSGVRLIKSNLVIEYNKITGNKSYGIYVDEDSEAQIQHNYIKDNDGYNVRIQKTRDIYK